MSQYIYIIRDIINKNIYKIGISKEPQKRIFNLQTGNPNKLKLIFELNSLSSIAFVQLSIAV